MRSHLVAIHVAVLLFGLSGLFAKLLVMSPLAIVWWRCLFAAVALGVVVGVRAKLTPPTSAIVGTGVLLAAHWVTFFHAIQISTVAIGLLSFSIFPVVVTLIEPLLDDERFHAPSIIYAFAALGGVALVIPEFEINSAGLRGAAWGAISGGLYAIVTVMNRKSVRHTSPLMIGLWQYVAAYLILTPFNLSAFQIELHSFGLLLLLGVVFTAGAHVLFIHGLRQVPARNAALVGTLEPVYGVVAAALIIAETPSLRTIIGGAIIMLTVATASKSTSECDPRL
jgi:drug/metabolite transporter (DMT)-like permease